MRASIYLNRKELQNYLKLRGYQSETIRKILISEFGYKTGKQFLQENTNLCSNVLNIKVSFKNQDEYREIVLRLSWIIKYLKNERDKAKIKSGFGGYALRLFGTDIVFLNPDSTYVIDYGDGDRNLSLWYYTEAVTFKRLFIEEITEKLGLYEIRMSI